MAAFCVAVLDVVVDQAEVVTELDRCRAGECLAMVAGDRGIGQQAEQRPHPLAAVGALPVERQVVADHLVQAVGRWVAIADESDDLAFGVGDEVVEVQVRGCCRHRDQCTPKHVRRK